MSSRVMVKHTKNRHGNLAIWQGSTIADLSLCSPWYYGDRFGGICPFTCFNTMAHAMIALEYTGYTTRAIVTHQKVNVTPVNNDQDNFPPFELPVTVGAVPPDVLAVLLQCLVQVFVNQAFYSGS